MYFNQKRLYSVKNVNTLMIIRNNRFEETKVNVYLSCIRHICNKNSTKPNRNEFFSKYL